jgi:hypothetical protein
MTCRADECKRKGGCEGCKHSQIICDECNDYLEGDRDICGVCADNLRMMLDEARAKLAEYESHGPEGHNVTNQQYVDLQSKLARYEAVVEAAYEWMRATCGCSALSPKQAEDKILEELNALTEVSHK